MRKEHDSHWTGGRGSSLPEPLKNVYSTCTPLRTLLKGPCCTSGQAQLTTARRLTTVRSRLYGVNCTKFGQLIFKKIIKIVASRCHILWLKCIKFDSATVHWVGRVMYRETDAPKCIDIAFDELADESHHHGPSLLVLLLVTTIIYVYIYVYVYSYMNITL